MNVPILPSALALRTADLRDPAERARIEAWVQTQAEATPFHLPHWSMAVAHGCGQRSHYLVAERANGAFAGVLPLTELHSPFFGRALASAGFGVGGGVLAAAPGVARQLADGAMALARRLHCTTVELRGGVRPGGEWQEDAETYLGFVRPIAVDDDAELLAIPRKQRAEVRRALGNQLEVMTGRGAEHARAHYAIYAESVRNLGTPVFPKRLFTEVMARFGEAADILIVRHQGVAVASVLSLYWNGTVYPYWGGGTAAARGLRANDRMYFALMGHARARGCDRFDFGRSKAGTGAAAFKKNWGFEPVPLTYFKRTTDGSTPRSVNPLDPKYSLQVRTWKRMPLWAANRVGPWIAKGLG
ncbi:FemAB family XrtA/PEP-CTERM system-associated protein [Sphingomonas xinjiangensis]|uniref:FemAB-related protein (PEP-CTERM system-associated) n=1 Tax=Sphingomonas xinjiangensis TaxID=643568 RepID=A0A840YJ77_9SPHN|nr:FemAB family XrtA/PEP-CTERM system-associated protein [Sphingomonas xinjiangensis]MBB5708856.1 FemAB-related protein (PEP-CTERM system-associated) [Sphingomonas xinjiangensis]